MQFSSGILRIRTSADTLVIGHRAAFGHGDGFCRLESEDEVRRRLIQAIADGASLDRLRAFWACWQFDTRRITNTIDRDLVDRVAQMTVRGPLSAYLVPDTSVQHLFGSAAKELVRSGPAPLPASMTPTPAPGGSPVSGGPAGIARVQPPGPVRAPGPLQPRGPTRPAPGEAETPLPVATLSIDERLDEVLRRVAPYLPLGTRDEAAKLLQPLMHSMATQVLAAWAETHFVGPGFVIDAVLAAAGLTHPGFTVMEAAEKIAQSLELVRPARNEQDLDEAAKPLAEAIALLGIGPFIAVIWRGANRFTSENKAPSTIRRAPEPVRTAPVRLMPRPSETNAFKFELPKAKAGIEWGKEGLKPKLSAKTGISKSVSYKQYGDDDAKITIGEAKGNLSIGYDHDFEKDTDTFGVDANAQVVAIAAEAKGSVANDMIEVKGQIEVLSAQASIKAGYVSSADYQGLKGEIGAEANLIKGSVSGQTNITPKTIYDNTLGKVVGLIKPEWAHLPAWIDHGIFVGGEVEGGIGAAASAKASVNLKDMSVSAGTKIGAGPMAGISLIFGIK